jgi:phage replication-related protein YjqB (UPF0714/DUF867 family)
MPLTVDKYKSFEELRKNEPPKNYVVDCCDRSSKFGIIAPHGGGIEPGTSEIAEHIARDTLSYFVFKGVKNKLNKDLHIASKRYDEPQARSLVQASDIAVSIHGEEGNNEKVYIGGLNANLISELTTVLEASGFSVSKTLPAGLAGKDPNNICNDCKSKEGLQIEISHGLRKKMFKDMTRKGRKEKTEKFEQFVAAVRKGIGIE